MYYFFIIPQIASKAIGYGKNYEISVSYDEKNMSEKVKKLSN